MDELIEQVDEQDRVLGVVRRSEAVRRRWLHRVAVTLCHDRDGRLLVHQRSPRASRFPGCYEVAVGGAVAVGESYEEAARRELAEEMGLAVPVRFVLAFLSQQGLSPHRLAVHEASVLGTVSPDPDCVTRHDWLAVSELSEFMQLQPFTPDSGPLLDRYLLATRRCASTSGPGPVEWTLPHTADDQEGAKPSPVTW
ncbi:NUDIX domain-containing protein [Streptomyces sp. NPDC090026]|uniref:NUDIX domain-containing protein n=1 Tax=Streptomyces sp. NPDC090026 TaxID=3365923 RepID=UPI0037F8EF24